jgi:FKBP-type peptidyl-prolyl cis-trans isomerase FklB
VVIPALPIIYHEEFSMKAVCLALLGLCLASGQGNAQEKRAIKTQKDSVSYSIGMNIANNFKRQSLDIDPALFGQAVRDVLSGGKTLMTQDQVEEVLAALQDRMQATQQVRSKALGEKNKKEGVAFLAANKKKEGVVTTESGLQYKVLRAGTGPIPTEGQTVTVNYRGKLIDGTEFENSYKRGTPATQAVTGFIKGWTEALKLMPVGSKWQLVIPPDLAYADQGAGQIIGPEATLVFEVELLSVK